VIPETPVACGCKSNENHYHLIASPKRDRSMPQRPVLHLVARPIHAGAPQSPLRHREHNALESNELLRGTREVLIHHGGEVYRLRHTRNDKLILTK
jgi:hemin uptake protein HemP